jgi:hypothetical protein
MSGDSMAKFAARQRSTANQEQLERKRRKKKKKKKRRIAKRKDSC